MYNLIILLILNIILKLKCLKSVNPIIDVSNTDMYSQHNENNEDIFTITKTGNLTTIFKRIFPEFSANKAWTTDGILMDNFATDNTGATSENNYISILDEDKEYFVHLYGVGSYRHPNGTKYNYTPILFLDENDNFKGCALNNTKNDYDNIISIPKDAKKMHITNYNGKNLRIQRILNMTNEQLDDIKKDLILTNERKEKLLLEINTNYENYKKDKTLYKKLTKSHIIFILDDTLPKIDKVADIFIEKKIPLCLATIPDNIIDNASNKKETRLEVLIRLIGNLGEKIEILSHSKIELPKEKIDDFETLYSIFIKPKQILTNYGFEINGIIFSGGEKESVEGEKWVSNFYSYSDYYGFEYNKSDLFTDHVYNHKRISLKSFKNDIESMKKTVDNAIENKEFLVFSFNFEKDDDITKDNLIAILDYVKDKEKNELLEITTYKKFYEEFAVKESEILNESYIYYVSNDGNSDSGLKKEDPMNLTTLLSKNFKSGDKILFKNGDIFYNKIDINFINFNNQLLTISNYGDTNLRKPKISGYKIIDKNESWEIMDINNSIYKINLKNTNNFKGVQNIDDNINKIGFLLDEKNNTYYNLKTNISDIENLYDFFCDGTYLYIKTNKTTPFEEFGILKLATNIKLFNLHSNMLIENLIIEGTGSNSMFDNSSNSLLENITIRNMIIENIGGSNLNENKRYGNAILFNNTDIKNITITKNIIRNVYNVGLAIQNISGNDILVNNNIFVCNLQDFEISEKNDNNGIHNYNFKNNIAINQGRGRDYNINQNNDATHILFGQFTLINNNTKIYFNNSYVYNPIRIFFIKSNNINTSDLFIKSDSIQPNFNKYYMKNDTTYLGNSYNYSQIFEYINNCNKDKNSSFNFLDSVDENIINTAKKSYDYDEIINKLFKKNKNKLYGEYSFFYLFGLTTFVVLALLGVILFIRYITKKNTASFNEIDYNMVIN